MSQAIAPDAIDDRSTSPSGQRLPREFLDGY